MKLTTEMLHRWHACAKQLALFETEWPNGVEINSANVARALELGLSVEWAVVLAARNGHLAALKALLDAGATVPALAVLQAARNGHLAALKALLDAGATVPELAVVRAVRNGHLAVAQALAEGCRMRLE